jgi:hypothetical protein
MASPPQMNSRSDHSGSHSSSVAPNANRDCEDQLADEMLENLGSATSGEELGKVGEFDGEGRGKMERFFKNPVKLAQSQRTSAMT